MPTKKELLAGLGYAQEIAAELFYVRGRYEEAADWFRSSAINGNNVAQRSYANMLYDGRGVKKDITKALKWYGKSASLGNAGAMYQFAYILLNDFKNTDCSGCTDRGITLMEGSAKLGYFKAINYLKTMPPKVTSSKKHTMTLRSQSKF